MYINFWYAMEESAKVTADEPLHVRRLSQDFVLFRDEDGKINCLQNTCSHRGASLGHGKIRNGHVECPYHGWQFNGGGDCVYIPSLGPDGQKIPKRTRIDSYPVHEEYGLIFAFLGDLPEDERPPLLLPHTNPYGVDYSGEQWRWVTQQWPLESNYERNIENGLDPAHNEFVHARHGFMGNRMDYAVPEYDPDMYPWGNGFMVIFQAPPSTDEVLHKAEDSRTEEGGLEAGSGHLGPNSMWTYIHITPTNWMHQYLYETPIEKDRTIAFNVNMCNFLDPDVAEDEEIREMNGIIAEDDVIVLERLSPKLTPPNMTSEVMMPSDKSVVEYRKFLKQWDAKGWRIDSDALEAAKGKEVHSIPSPRRRTEKGWVFNTVPLITGEE